MSKKDLSSSSDNLKKTFESSSAYQKKQPSKRPAPFSIRLTQNERERLVREAAGAPLGTYIKAKALGDKPIRMRRTGQRPMRRYSPCWDAPSFPAISISSPML